VRARAGRGPRLPAHQVTTRNLGAAYPFVAEPGLGHRGVVIGHDLLGGAFAYDPFELYTRGVLSNPNAIVFGQIGRGKSAFVKTYLWRQAVFGRRAWVVDPKGEYGALARAWDVAPVALRPGGTVRLNPLDPVGPVGPDDRGRTDLLASLATACLGRDIGPRERVAIDLALDESCRRGRVPTLPDVVEALLDPTDAAARTIRTDRSTLLEDGRDVALELRRLVWGDLRGMFDGPTSPGLDLGGRLVVLDLSALYHSAALGILMTCATAWLQAALAGRRTRPAADETARHDDSGDSDVAAGVSTERRDTDDPVIVVVDEAWAILANLGVARWLQASWKLARAHGVANMAVLHRLSDLDAVGAHDSEQVGLARGLLSDSETRVVYAQPPGELARAADLLSLSSTETELLGTLRRGIALWKVGSRSFLVRHQLGPHEHGLVDTDGAMRPAGR
jgi:hypothetical protein